MGAKVTLMVLAGAIVTILFYVLKTIWGIEPGTEIQGAATTVVLVLLSYALHKDGGDNAVS